MPDPTCVNCPGKCELLEDQSDVLSGWDVVELDEVKKEVADGQADVRLLSAAHS